MKKQNKEKEIDYSKVAEKILNVVYNDFKYFDFFFCSIFDHEYYSAEKIKNDVAISVELFPKKSRIDIKLIDEGKNPLNPVCMSISTICFPKNENYKICGHVKEMGKAIRDENCFSVYPPKNYFNWITDIINKNRRSVHLSKEEGLDLSCGISNPINDTTSKMHVLPDNDKLTKLINRYAGVRIRNSKTAKKKQK